MATPTDSMPNPLLGAETLFNSPTIPEVKVGGSASGSESTSSQTRTLLNAVNPMQLTPATKRQEAELGLQDVREQARAIGVKKLDALQNAAKEISGIRAESRAALNDLTPPEPFPEEPRQAKYSAEIASDMAVFAVAAMLGGLGTQQPILNAMNAMAAGLTAYRKGRQEDYKRSLEEWKIHTDIAKNRWTQYREQRNAIIQEADSTLEQKNADLKVLDASYGVVLKDLENQQSSFEDRLKAYDKHDEQYFKFENAINQAQWRIDSQREAREARQNWQETLRQDRLDRDESRSEDKKTKEMWSMADKARASYEKRVQPYRNMMDLADQALAEIYLALSNATVKGAITKRTEPNIDTQTSELIQSKIRQFRDESIKTNMQMLRDDKFTGGFVERELNNYNRFIKGTLSYQQIREAGGMLLSSKKNFYIPRMQKIWEQVESAALLHGYKPEDVYGSDKEVYQ